MVNHRADSDLTDTDRGLEERYGAYASYYDSEAAPEHVDHYGEIAPHAELERLVGVYARPDGRVLDLGCGAGFVACRMAPQVAEAWGFDQDSHLLAAARRRAEVRGLANVTLVEGNAAVAGDLATLPDAYFDLVWSQRGPSFNAGLMRALRPDAVAIQELVTDADAYPLKEICGRRAYAPVLPGPEGLIAYYANLGLLPVSVKDYAYDQFFRDVDHLETSLRKGLALADWRVASPGEYRQERDRDALELYARYYATDQGIRVARRGLVFVLRRAAVHYYPVDGTPSAPDA